MYTYEVDHEKKQVYAVIKNLDLTRIAQSGQCFRWKKVEQEEEGDNAEQACQGEWGKSTECSAEYEIPAFHRKLRVRQQGESFTFFCSEETVQNVWRSYLDFDTPYEEYLASVDERDSFLKAAAAYGNGIRILRQDPWEAAVSFLISQCNNIPRIKGCIEKICAHFGEEGYYFPSPERLAGLTEEELLVFRKECSLGYRDEYILNFAKKVSEGSFSLEECGKLPYEECVRELRTLQGVGQKVADCIALYGFHKIDAFPIDVHMKRILYERYFTPDLETFSRSKQLKAMEERNFSQYTGYRGIVQQWIFAYNLI